MEKRYQVFVSSTYVDLKEERQEVMRALMEMDCIPAGMELFPAADEEQWEFIKKIVDDCDYYLLIIGGRYGSLSPEGISYTEMEFDYAVESGLKVIALLHDDPSLIAAGKTDVDPELQQKLSDFREKVSDGRLVKHWTEPKELPGLVALSISRTIKAYPAIGWVRSNKILSSDAAVELAELKADNEKLKSSIAKLKRAELPKDIAELDEEFEVTGYSFNTHMGSKTWDASICWRDMFSIFSPYLKAYCGESTVKSKLSEGISKKFENVRNAGRSATIDDQCFQTIALQFEAQQLVKIEKLKTTKGSKAFFWSLTGAGKNLMLDLRVVRSGNSDK